MDHAEAYRLAELRIKQEAASVYATFDKNERTIVRFGMFPRAKMEAAEKKLLEEPFPMFDKQDVARLLAVGVMDAANAGPDKMVV